jgi:mono/diheme cytochrome c family protein
MRIEKIYLFLITILIFTLTAWISSCRHDTILSSSIPEICFYSEVLPVFENNCNISGCHDGTRGSRSSYNSYANISSGVVAGNPNGSSLYQAIIGKSGEGLMPPNKPLTIENRTTIRVWIEQGAKETLCGDTTSLPPVTPPSSYNTRACFTRDIQPVLVSGCAMAGCHDAITHREGYNFTTYSSTMNAVNPGNPSGSQLYRSVTTTSGENRMPPSPTPRLTTAQIDSISAWIRYGALNETCGEICDTINPVTFSGVIWPTIQTTCTGCHTTASSSNGNISLTGYTDVRTIAASGKLMNALNGNGVTKMPPSGSLSACKIRQFQIWINKGYLNN